MHELAIADALLRIALRHAEGRRIESVEVKVGHLRQVVPDALTFAWTLVNSFIKSDGGNGQASLRMVNLLRTYFKRVTALVPLNCESAATMFVLGTNDRWSANTLSTAVTTTNFSWGDPA